ncbi:CRISPR-associated endonuclease Cas2 [Ornatilinea apprima]|uniref:CRISPR-associated endonuclease Cas2 n=1 Tax=Ornatilinea apprima TaxID=1134406 RepID=UPI0009468420|nr:CRISPR-associated endonuclease Cas2 [Ornatilinea apprima]
MSDKQFILVVYDISNDKRRTKLHNTLLNFGTPVQYSVFECLLTDKEKETMLKAVKRVIRPRKDRLRFYYICAACLKKTHITSGVEVTTDEAKSFVVG